MYFIQIKHCAFQCLKARSALSLSEVHGVYLGPKNAHMNMHTHVHTCTDMHMCCLGAGWVHGAAEPQCPVPPVLPQQCSHRFRARASLRCALCHSIRSTDDPSPGTTQAPWAQGLWERLGGPYPYPAADLSWHRAGSQCSLHGDSVPQGCVVPSTAAFADQMHNQTSHSQLRCQGWKEESEAAHNEPIRMLMEGEQEALLNHSAWLDAALGSFPNSTSQLCPCQRAADSSCLGHPSPLVKPQENPRLCPKASPLCCPRRCAPGTLVLANRDSIRTWVLCGCSHVGSSHP